ncbi:hypothetical protein DNH61_14155 [Paenibacillus sambharensis]|uniref:DNA/RNA helicase n=1 Tax=Paenibacillus sambharensis TaxID=1803190 RepID=A0A2W1LVX0_9BACL|nr:hypothetical protein [Paenibacillus sambharensis]PZD95657.1 hypothetical protein DNH61_14155 [Paenibacillus sambharensis]
MDHAVQFSFASSNEASMAYATLQELGYSPVREEERVHVHIQQGDLTSALEIAMAHGGQLCGQAAIRDNMVIETAYDMDAIPIPAHTVNEDWAEAYASDRPGNDELRNRDDAAADMEFDPDGGEYGFFSGDVRA